MITLSVRQPWAWLIIHGPKRIENRRWTTNYRGLLAIHASKTFDVDSYVELLYDETVPIMPSRHDFDMGGIIGVVDLVGIVTESDNPWFEGPFGWVLENPKSVPFYKCRGQLSLFEVPGFKNV
jgi:hypothetical protein